MKAAGTTVSLALGLILVVESVVAWRQYQELIVLRAQVGLDDRADLLKRLDEAEKRLKVMAGHVEAALPPAQGQPEVKVEANGPPNAQLRARDRFLSGFQSVLNDPRYQKLVAMQEKAGLDERYATLFRSLNLTPDQVDQFKNLLVQKQQAMQDAATVARQQGLSPLNDPTGFQQAVHDSQAPIDQQIQSTLGGAGYAQYQQYQQTLPQRATVNQVTQALSYSQTPLTDDEANKLAAILAQDQPGPAGPNGAGPGTITPQALADAQSVLSPSQVQALQQVQQLQQAQVQMQQLMRAAQEAARGTDAGAAPPNGGG